MTRLAVIVPATNAPRTLAAAVEAIEAAIGPEDELVVVDDAELTSPAAARNAGVARTRADVIVFVDADVAVHADALARIRNAFAADEELAAVFGSYDDDPVVRDPISAFRNLLHHHVHQEAGGVAVTFWAGLGAIRRTWFNGIGGFVDHPVEDIELGMRLHAAGGKIRLDPRVLGTHLKRWTLASMVRTDLLVRGAPWVGLLLRHRSTGAGLNLGWRHRLSALASMAVVVGLLLALVEPLLTAAVALGAAVATLLALNLSFYRLLARRRGLRYAAVGFALHVVHHLVAVVAVPVGLAAYALDGRRGKEPAPDRPADTPAT